MSAVANSRNVLRFCIVGGFVFGVDLAMVWLWNLFTPPLVAVSVAYFMAVAVHFCLNKWWVFKDRRDACAGQVYKYALTVAACWLCTVVVVSVVLRFVTPHVLAAKLLALLPTTAMGFVLMRMFVFPRSLS